MGAGMSPAMGQILSSLITGGLGFAGGMLEGDPQQATSFQDGSATSPTELLKSLSGMLQGTYQDATQRAHQPVELPSAYVQDVPTFTGGGLPMPIGVTGHDPANAHPELKRIINGKIGEWSPTQGDPVHRSTDLLSQPEDHTDITGDNPISTNLPGYRSLVARRTRPGQDATDPNASAYGAIDLLRHAMGA